MVFMLGRPSRSLFKYASRRHCKTHVVIQHQYDAVSLFAAGGDHGARRSPHIAKDPSHLLSLAHESGKGDDMEGPPTFWERLEWSTKSLIILASTIAFFCGWYEYNEYYRRLGVVHPITAWITRNMTVEVKDRLARIENIEEQHQSALLRLKRFNDWLPSMQPLGARPIFGSDALSESIALIPSDRDTSQV